MNACIADTHLTVPEPESLSLFPRQISLDPEGRALYRKMRGEIHRAYRTCLEQIRQYHLDFLVHLGDITGGWREQGCAHSSARKLLEQTKVDFERTSSKVRFVLGNHDVGYSHKGSLPKSGINPASVLTCQEVLGDIFWKEDQGSILSIGICSPVAEYKGFQKDLRRLKEEQRAFLGDELSGHKGPWILYTHNPFVPIHFSLQMRDHQNDLLRMVCGDFHDPRRGMLIKRAAQTAPIENLLVHCLKKCVFCPSTAPLWWKGYGFLLSGKQVLSSPPPDHEELPTSSFWRCLWWMMKKNKKLSK